MMIIGCVLPPTGDHPPSVQPYYICSVSTPFLPSPCLIPVVLNAQWKEQSVLRLQPCPVGLDMRDQVHVFDICDTGSRTEHSQLTKAN